MPKRQYKKITPKARFEMLKMMEENGSVDKDGYYAYKNGMTDADIAAKFDVNEWTVSETRKAVFGKMRPLDIEQVRAARTRTVASKTAALEQEIADLQAESRRLRTCIDSFQAWIERTSKSLDSMERKDKAIEHKLDGLTARMIEAEMKISKAKEVSQKPNASADAVARFDVSSIQNLK
jgi:septal ring factor EnvC (AmiA/AmiB activator)